MIIIINFYMIESRGLKGVQFCCITSVVRLLHYFNFVIIKGVDLMSLLIVSVISPISIQTPVWNGFKVPFCVCSRGFYHPLDVVYKFIPATSLLEPMLEPNQHGELWWSAAHKHNKIDRLYSNNHCNIFAAFQS